MQQVSHTELQLMASNAQQVQATCHTAVLGCSVSSMEVLAVLYCRNMIPSPWILTKPHLQQPASPLYHQVAPALACPHLLSLCVKLLSNAAGLAVAAAHNVPTLWMVSARAQFDPSLHVSAECSPQCPCTVSKCKLTCNLSHNVCTGALPRLTDHQAATAQVRLSIQHLQVRSPPMQITSCFAFRMIIKDAQASGHASICAFISSHLVRPTTSTYGIGHRLSADGYAASGQACLQSSTVCVTVRHTSL